MLGTNEFELTQTDPSQSSSIDLSKLPEGFSKHDLEVACNEIGISTDAYYYRRHKGMTHEEALSLPKRR